MRPLEGISVLVVDDNPDVLDLLVTTFTYFGALVVSAEDGKDALAYLARVRVNVIVGDLSMPGFSGFDFIRSVRQLPDIAARATPAIALTAFNEPEQRRLALAAGFQSYVVKPFDPSLLMQEILRLVVPDRVE